MTLKPHAYLVLGMLRLGAKSGYAIKKAADSGTRFTWPTSLAQVYPELARLEREGLVTRREDPKGARARAAYELTDKGEAALLSWLRETDIGPLQFRDEGSLRLFFADALPRQDQLALIGRMRERAQDTKTYLRREVLPLAEALEPAGTRFPAIVGRLGADSWAYWERWLARLEAQISEEGSPD